MPDPPPIRQRIEADFDDKGFKAAARDTKALGDATEKSGKQADQASRKTRTREQKLADLQRCLVELVRAEDRHEREVNQGRQADERAIQASRRRQRQIDRTARALGNEQRVQNRASAAVSGHAAAQAGLAGSLGGVGSAVRGLLPVLGVGVGLLGAYRLIKNELDAIIDRQEKAFQTQVTLASAQRQLKKNLPGASSEEIDRLFGEAGRISLETGISEPVITSAFASAASATAGDKEKFVPLVELAAQFSAEDPAQIASVAGGLGDTQGAIQTDDPFVALGFLSTVAGLSRVSTPERQFKNIPPALAGLVSLGFTPPEAGSLNAALSVATKDITGEQTKTASINFGNRINELFRALGRPERAGEALAALQTDPELARQFVEGGEIIQGGKSVSLPELTAEAQSITALRDLLLKPESEVAQNFQAFQPKFGDPDQLRRVGEALLAELSRGEIEKTAEVGRRLSTAAEALKSTNLSGGRAGAVRSGIIEVLKASGEGALATKFDELEFTLGGSLNNEAVKKGIELINARVEDLQRPGRQRRLSQRQLIAVQTGVDVGDVPDSGPSRFVAGQVESLQQLVGQLEEIGDTPANVTIIHGTQINQGRDPRTSDLAEGERPRN